MRLQSTNWFWITAATILVVSAVCVFPSRVQADWSYEYQDNFSTNKVERDSFLHSVFWPQGAFPPPQTYLYYLGTESQRELGFGDYQGQLALLVWRLPVGSEKSRGAVHGNLWVDVRLPYSMDVASGYLQYEFSSDSVTWSSPQQLGPGSHNLPIESVRGNCYVRFRGSEVLIDNLEVSLYSSPATVRVPQDFSTIQAAINSAGHGDIVEVSPGTYSGEGNWDIDFQGKAITLCSEAGPGRTVIDCADQDHRGFYFHRAEGPSSVLRGFTITNAHVSGSEVGGGIYCDSSNPTIIDCVIQQCTAGLGGGIGILSGEPTIIDCAIEDCYADSANMGAESGNGAGIGLIGSSNATIINCEINNNIISSQVGNGAGVYCWHSSAMLMNCNVSFNNAQGNSEGGGVYCGGSSAGIVLERCIISNNTAEVGGGIFASSLAYVRVTNCTIADNNLFAAQQTVGGGIHSISSDTVIRNSIVWDNDGPAVVLAGSASSNPVLYSNIEGGFQGQGNIDADPMFASSAAADYHLKSAYGRYDPDWSEWVTDYDHSPCIDAGDPQDSVGSEPFPNNNRINMGAYGGTSEASKSIGPLIFHVDGDNGSDSNTGLSRTSAFATIQRAVGEAINGDFVMVWPGIYQEEVTFDRKRITVQSADDAAVVMAPNSYAFSFYGAESSRSILRNFVIINCGEAAVFCHGGSPELINLTIADNQFGVQAYGGADPSVTNCILWNNEFGDLFGDLFQPRAHYSCLQQLRALDEDRGNISTDPLFADSDNGDYHLQSRYGRFRSEDRVWVTDSQTSPCINKGDPSMYRGRERDGGRVNMGAYGGTPYASLSGSSW